jgi:hypothetical protein
MVVGQIKYHVDLNIQKICLKNLLFCFGAYLSIFRYLSFPLTLFSLSPYYCFLCFPFFLISAVFWKLELHYLPFFSVLEKSTLAMTKSKDIGEHTVSVHKFCYCVLTLRKAWVWWLTPVILATWEAEVRMIMVWDQCHKKLVRFHLIQ